MQRFRGLHSGYSHSERLCFIRLLLFCLLVMTVVPLTVAEVLPIQERELEDTARELLNVHPEWQILPTEKLESLKPAPYGYTGRGWELFYDHALSLGLLPAICSLEEGSGEYLLAGGLLSDVASSMSQFELIWRVGVASFNSQPLIKALGGKSNLFWAQRGAALVPAVVSNLPEIFWQLGLIRTSRSHIKLYPESLGKYFSFSFVASDALVEGLPFPRIDMKIHPTSIQNEPHQTGYEEALVALHESARTNGITKISFYGAKETVDKKSQLSLYLRLHSNIQEPRLIRFPVNFGETGSGIWWTEALEKRWIQRVYNKDDQYKIVQSLNYLLGYGKPLLNPISKGILEQVPELIETSLFADEEESFTSHWEGYTWSHADTALSLDVDDVSKLAAKAIPAQSQSHTLISNGASGGIFIDDYESQSVGMPKITLLPSADSSWITNKSLVQLEKHLPWLYPRGVYAIARNVALSATYMGLLTTIRISAAINVRVRREI
ncbi:hypothetical protein [Parendozoicomonas sp. Alg238-R29]|uniref:hypothetical protein n=1 Tax=Parendozoicomonas sp. Alg238-R29 TaxID=2993446 RepID=UPI00248DED6A|nr:hypothetical protein [Parendozoicomonas sp. Alg238-R29]